MSWAVRASVFIALDSHKGEWCTPAWIAGRVLTSIDSVVVCCEQLVESGEVQFQLGDGTPLFGVDVVEEHPVINDVASAAGGAA